MASKDKHLETVKDVLEAIGVDRAMKLARARAKTAPGTWRWRGCFSPRSYVAMTTELERRGFTAPPSLWGQYEHRAG